MSLGTNASGGVALDDRMTAVGDDHLVAVVHVRLGVVGDRRGLGQRRQHVERRQGARRVLDPRRLGGHARAQLLEDLQLALEDPLVGAEHLLFVFLERRRREPLAAGNRLLPRGSRPGRRAGSTSRSRCSSRTRG